MKNKGLIVITGASSGIGKSVAEHFSKLGHPLLLVARRVEKLRELNLPQTICREVDIIDTKSLQEAIKFAENEYGPVDCLINNAGLMLLGQIDTQDSTEWDKMFQLNVMALLRGTQLVLGDMKKRRSGTIFNISSIAGKKSFPNHAAYCGTKFAVSAITESLREEFSAYGIRVISVCPGAVETELLGHTTSKEIKDGYEGWKESIGGALAANDIARTILFAYQQPQNVCLREILIAATGQQA